MARSCGVLALFARLALFLLVRGGEFVEVEVEVEDR